MMDETIRQAMQAGVATLLIVVYTFVIHPRNLAVFREEMGKLRAVLSEMSTRLKRVEKKLGIREDE